MREQTFYLYVRHLTDLSDLFKRFLRGQEADPSHTGVERNVYERVSVQLYGLAGNAFCSLRIEHAHADILLDKLTPVLDKGIPENKNGLLDSCLPENKGLACRGDCKSPHIGDIFHEPGNFYRSVTVGVCLDHSGDLRTGSEIFCHIVKVALHCGQINIRPDSSVHK